MKKLTIIIILMALTACGNGKTFTRAAEYMEAVFWGDSITDGCADHFTGLNRAVPGDNSEAMLELVEYYTPNDEPAKHHVMIGTNDVWQGMADTYAYRLNAILALLKGEVTVTSVLPTRYEDKNARIIEINAEAQALAEHWGHDYRDVYADFVDDDGLLADEYTSDGVHLTATGCEKLFAGTKGE